MLTLFEAEIVHRPKGGRPPLKGDPDHAARRAIARTLRDEGYSRREIAERLGVDRRTLLNWAEMDRPARAS